VRAPLASVFREGARGLFAEQEGDWVEQSGEAGDMYARRLQIQERMTNQIARGRWKISIAPQAWA